MLLRKEILQCLEDMEQKLTKLEEQVIEKVFLEKQHSLWVLQQKEESIKEHVEELEHCVDMLGAIPWKQSLEFSLKTS
jgi:hypothetical protein